MGLRPPTGSPFSHLYKGAVEDIGGLGGLMLCAFNDENKACDLVGLISSASLRRAGTGSVDKGLVTLE